MTFYTFHSTAHQMISTGLRQSDIPCLSSIRTREGWWNWIVWNIWMNRTTIIISAYHASKSVASSHPTYMPNIVNVVQKLIGKIRKTAFFYRAKKTQRVHAWLNIEYWSLVVQWRLRRANQHSNDVCRFLIVGEIDAWHKDHVHKGLLTVPFLAIRHVVCLQVTFWTPCTLLTLTRSLLVCLYYISILWPGAVGSGLAIALVWL